MRRVPLCLLLLLSACEFGGGSGKDWNKKSEDYVLAVRVAPPTRDVVEDYVHTTATLESDRRAQIYAQVDGIIVQKVKDLGDFVRASGHGGAALLLGRIDDRDLTLALREAEIHLEDTLARIEERKLERKTAEQELDQAEVTQEEATKNFERAETGIRDGTFSIEEYDKARFARTLAQKKVLTQQSALEMAEVALKIGRIMVKDAEVERDRAGVAKEKSALVAPFSGVVSYCSLREGERVKVGDHLYTIEDPDTLVVFAQIPVRQATRIEAGDVVQVSSTAAPAATSGEVLLVAPTVSEDSGTITVKVAVQPAPGFRPGLYVSLKIVVDTRKDALVVPKTAVMHDDEEGAYIFIVEKDEAKRVLVKTGFGRGKIIEITEGVEESTRVVVEGQDTLTHGAKVAVQES
ncbi:MAG: efflux RND transporter periplasmic adaptor subunit [Planctomycetota bacterium]|nr:efflux RND transporter periplasmic adaptor subunit [Planctomycetota bacterium]